MIIKKIIISVVGIIASGAILWLMTGNWIQTGKRPIANGEHPYAIILGAKVNGETPSLSLQYRLDAALQYAEKHPHVTFILSGGQGPGEFITEAEAMKIYLMEHGINEERMLLEKQSTSTYENLLFSKGLLPPQVKGITIISSDYHLARAKKLAASLGLQVNVIPAKTPKIVRHKLFARERLALLKTMMVGK
ncbi:YdcF family protein [Bacillus sp. FJAT-50079]|uniref:YdcF family protein n=1 Tax=Bacillus sp. FJAT-50079 TaxID=2833577 RepID=UPI001BC903FA|nr:YdcF family protein [Bacillus sp. FJAT-50079]MBS4206851.1 YdcF family protein [Bacillus sp. FJAT-50079]